MVVVPIEVLRELSRLAEEGEFFEIRVQTTRLESKNEACAPFARQLHQLAKGFDMKQVEARIGSFIR